MRHILRLSWLASLLRRVGQPGWLALAAAAYAVQEFGISHLGQDGWEATLRRFLFFTTTAIVVVLALHFRRYVGAWLIAGGILMNVLPMAAHGGLMPVSYEVIEDSGAFPEITTADIGRQVPNSKDIVLLKDDIRFELLSDRFFISIPGYGANIYSAGDFVAFTGLLLAAIQIIAAVFIPSLGTRKPRPAPSREPLARC